MFISNYKLILRGLTTNPISAGYIIASLLHFKYFRSIFKLPFISAFTFKPVPVIYKPLCNLLPLNLYLTTGLFCLYIGILSLSKKDALLV